MINNDYKIYGNHIDVLNKYKKDNKTKYLELKNMNCYKNVQDMVTYCIYNNEISRQGWKIHVSSTFSNYEDVLRKVSNICNENKITFKYVNNNNDLLRLVSKDCPPLSVGKLITIYPTDTEEFIRIISILHECTKKYSGVDILTDMKYKDSQVIHYRYGLMKIEEEKENDSDREKIFGPNGEEFDDIVGPFYYLPDFIEDPLIKQNNNEERNEDIILNDKYKMLSIIKLSSGGNVYDAINLNTDKKVIIKEARQNILVTEDYSVYQLLKNERNILKRMDNTNLLPKYIDEFESEGSYFLVEEFVNGKSLKEMSSDLNILAPLTDEKLEYTNSLLYELIENIKSYIQALHSQGLIINDLSAENIIIGEQQEIKIIDFDSSYFFDENTDVLETTNKGIGDVPRYLNSKQRDFYKLGLIFMGITTGVDKLVDFDKSGRKSINVFESIASMRRLGNRITKELLDLVCNDLIERKKFSFSLNERENLKELIEFRKGLYKTLIINKNSMTFNNKDVYSNWENVKYLNKYKLNNNKEESWLHDIKKILDERYLMTDYDLKTKGELLRVDLQMNKNDISQNKKDIDSYLKKLKTEATTLEDSSLSILFLSLINDILENIGEDEYYEKEFEKFIFDTIEERIMMFEGKSYVKHFKYGTPYLSSGNSGLIVQLIRNMELRNNSQYKELIIKLSEGINHKFAKNIGVQDGLSGLGIANFKLYKFLGDKKFLKRYLEICNVIKLYNIEVYGLILIPSGNFEGISYEYQDGVLGYYRLLDEINNIGGYNEKIFYK